MIEELVFGMLPSDKLVRALEVRLSKGPIDVVIALIGGYDRRAERRPPRNLKALDIAAVRTDALYSPKPMFVAVLQGALENWGEELKQRGLRGLLRPDERAARPVFRQGSRHAAAAAPPSSRTSLPAPESGATGCRRDHSLNTWRSKMPARTGRCPR